MGTSNGKLRLVLLSALDRNLFDILLSSLIEDINTPSGREVEALVLLQRVQAIKRSLWELFDFQVTRNSGRCDTLGQNDGVTLDGPAGEKSTCFQ